MGFTNVHSAYNGSEAVQLAETNKYVRVQTLFLLLGTKHANRHAPSSHIWLRYGLIIMDCQMPIMDGFEASRAIRRLSLPQPAIVAVTANALVGERERCLKAGMDDYLSKPFQAEQLVAVVLKWIDLRRTAKEQAATA